MERIKDALDRNQRWARQITKIDPAYFDKHAFEQRPEYLWIGCADSRVPAQQIIDADSGELFVHRNIANVVVSSDLNCLSVLQYAIWNLGVQRILVCGHYGCGGIKAALSPEPNGLIDNWLNHIRVVREKHADKFVDVKDKDEEADLLCELNVIEQVNNVCRTTIIQSAWAEGRTCSVHGLVYSIKNGILRGLCVRDGSEDTP